MSIVIGTIILYARNLTTPHNPSIRQHQRRRQRNFTARVITQLLIRNKNQIWVGTLSQYLYPRVYCPSWSLPLMNPSHKSHNALNKYTTMHTFVCPFLLHNGALWYMELVHCEICSLSRGGFDLQNSVKPASILEHGNNKKERSRKTKVSNYSLMP